MNFGVVDREETGSAACERHNCQHGDVDCGLDWTVLHRNRCKTASFHAPLDRHSPPLLYRSGFTGKGALWRRKKAVHELRSSPRLCGLTRKTPTLLHGSCLEGREYVLKQSCAEFLLWMILWFCAETGSFFLDDQSQAVGSVVGYVLTRVHVLAARHSKFFICLLSL